MDYIHWIRSKVGQERVFINAANAIIVDPSGKILLQRRGDHTSEAWCTPGGAIELGESAEEAVRREVREETGLEIEIDYFLGAYTRNTQVSYPNGDLCQMMLYSFVCHPQAGELKLDNIETKELRYVDPRDPDRPKLFREHLERALSDYLSGKKGVID